MYTYNTFSSAAELIDFLNGTVIGSPLPSVVRGLHGLTLKVNDGSTDYSIVFSDPLGFGLSPSAILDQIQCETITLSAAPATDWAAGDIITGQTSHATATVVSKVSTFIYKIKQYKGSFALGEIVGVTGVTAKLAQQGAGNPTFATFANLANVKLRSYGLSPQSWQLVLDKVGYAVKAGTANALLGWPATATIAEITQTNIVHVTTSIASGQKYCVITHS